ncbi:MAG: OmpL47-type beta-barrel domain-containing protein, partial [Candidatus Rokuibacteriota bacterium]
TVDNTGPDGALYVNEGTGPGLQWFDSAGGTLYYNPAANGDFTVTVTPVAPGEVQAVDFPAIAETGFSGPAKIDATTPFDSDAYAYTSANTDAPADLLPVVTDLLGNPTVLTLAFVRDAAPPAGGSVSYPDGYDADGDVTITLDPGSDALAGLDPASAVLERRTSPLADGSCDPFAGAWSTVTSPDTVPSGQCAQYRHRVSDRVGNEATYTSSDVVKVDLADPAAPALTLDETSPYAYASGTQLYLNTAQSGVYDVAAASSDPVSGLEKIAFPGGSEDTSAPYGSSYDFDDLAPGTHTVTAHDRAGNTASSTFDVSADVDAPSTTDDSGATGSSWQTAPVTVTLAPVDPGAGVAATYYTTDGSAPTTSSDEGTTVSLAADGVYTIRYFSLDRVGNAEPVQTAAATIRIDGTNPDAPAIALDESSPHAHVAGEEIFLNTAQAGFYTVSATSADAGSGLERIRFPGGVDDFTSPYSMIVGLGDLSGTQTVTAYDAAGNNASDTFTATPDTAPPGGGSVSYADGYDADGTVPVSTADGTDALAGVDASSGVLERQTDPLVDGTCDPFAGGWSAVTSPDTVATDTCARYRYRVSDRVGNEATYTSSDVVKVDLTTPQTTIDSAPADPSADDSPSFAFSSSEAGVTFECRLDGGAWSACSSPESLAGLADGPHTFDVRATDAAGNVDPTPASHGWTVDTGAPQTTIDVAPSDPSNDDAPTLEFSADESGASFECRLDGGAWTACTSPETLGGLTDGPHTFDVRATDGAGNTDGSPASHAWTVDTVAPATTIDVAPGDPSNDPDPSFEFSASEGGSTFECRLDGGAWNGCSSPESLAGLADGPHTFDV